MQFTPTHYSIYPQDRTINTIYSNRQYSIYPQDRTINTNNLLQQTLLNLPQDRTINTHKITPTDTTKSTLKTGLSTQFAPTDTTQSILKTGLSTQTIYSNRHYSIYPQARTINTNTSLQQTLLNLPSRQHYQQKWFTPTDTTQPTLKNYQHK